MWQKLKVNQFLELKEVEKASYDSIIEKSIDILSIVLDEDPELIGEWSLSRIDETMKDCSWIYKEPPRTIKERIQEYNRKEFKDITVGEYIEISNYFQEDYIENLPNICAVVYRQTRINEWGHKMVEPYDYDPAERSSIFENVFVTDVYGIISEFIKFKEDFENTYAPLFEPEFSEGDEDYQPDKEDKQEEEKKKFSWEHFVYNLCNGDLTKTDEVLNLGLIYTFNMLAMRKTFGD